MKIYKILLAGLAAFMLSPSSSWADHHEDPASDEEAYEESEESSEEMDADHETEGEPHAHGAKKDPKKMNEKKKK